MLTVIIKATEYCNSNCIYCAVRDKETKRERMSIATLRLFLERVREYLAHDPERRVNLTWHGGEPVLMGEEFYDAVHLLSQEILRDHLARVEHSMQSNVTLMTDAFARMLSKLGVRSVGTSYEYTPGLRGFGPTQDSDAYNREFFRGLACLRRHGISAGVIYVVTSRSVDRPVETMVFLGNLLGNSLRGHFRLNPLYREGEASRGAMDDLFITPEQYGHFLGRAYEFWLPRRHLLGRVAPFQAFHMAVHGEPARLSCEDTGVCGSTHLALSPDGRCFQCGRAMDNGALELGSIQDKPIDELFRHPLKRELMGRSRQLRETDCAGCNVWDYCHGGCPVDSRIYFDDFRHRTHLCATRKIFLEEYVLPLQRSKAAPKAAGGAGCRPQP